MKESNHTIDELKQEYEQIPVSPHAKERILAGIAQGKAAAASIGLVAKRPEQFGKAMIFPAMVETYAILALLISILSIFGIAGLNI